MKITKEQRRKNMQAVKSTGSKIETLLAKAIWAEGIRYRKNDKTVFGKPDLTLKKYKIAIFADSEFWHGKNWKSRKYDHKTNIEFWRTKIERNIVRDQEVNSHLKREGWVVIRFWGIEIEQNVNECVTKVKKEIVAVMKYSNKGK